MDRSKEPPFGSLTPCWSPYPCISYVALTPLCESSRSRGPSMVVWVWQFFLLLRSKLIQCTVLLRIRLIQPACLSWYSGQQYCILSSLGLASSFASTQNFSKGASFAIRHRDCLQFFIRLPHESPKFVSKLSKHKVRLGFRLVEVHLISIIWSPNGYRLNIN